MSTINNIICHNYYLSHHEERKNCKISKPKCKPNFYLTGIGYRIGQWVGEMTKINKHTRQNNNISKLNFRYDIFLNNLTERIYFKTRIKMKTTIRGHLLNCLKIVKNCQYSIRLMVIFTDCGISRRQTIVIFLVTNL